MSFLHRPSVSALTLGFKPANRISWLNPFHIPARAFLRLSFKRAYKFLVSTLDNMR